MNALGQWLSDEDGWDLMCAGCGDNTRIVPQEGIAVPDPRQRRAWRLGFRLVPGFGWLCGQCFDCVPEVDVLGSVEVVGER